MQPLVLWKTNKYCIFRVCVYIALGTQYAMRMHHIFICGLSDSTIRFHIISQTVRFWWEKMLLDIKRVLISSTNFDGNICHSKLAMNEI